VDKTQRQAALARGGLSREWPAEPMLGAWYTEEEIETVVNTIRASMDPAVGFGFFCDEIVDFERQFAEYCGTEYAISITSAGAGLDMAVMALDLEPGDEVIVPAINFKAAFYAVAGQKGKIVLGEADPVTLCLDPADVEKKMSPRTRAILATHMNGISAPIDDYLEIAERHPHPEYGPPKVIGDAARALGAEYNGAKVGKKGWMTVFSFHTMKLMTTLGEGGAITTDDPAAIRRLRGLRQWGVDITTEDMAVHLGKRKTGDTLAGWGTNYKMTKVQAAVGSVQLRRLDEMLAARIRVAQRRTQMLKDIPELTLPVEPPGYKHVYYLYNILVPPEWAGEKRDRLMAILKDDFGVDTVVANPPTYLTDAFVRRNTEGQSCPLSEELGARLLCPPIHGQMSDADNEYICAAIAEGVERVKAGK
jgi:perosamine synthetase